MSFRTKKILAVVGFVVVVIAIGTALYLTFFRAAPETPTVSPPISDEAEPGSLPTSGTAGDREVFVPGEPGTIPTAGDIVSPVAIGGLTEVTDLTLTSVTNPTLSDDGGSLNFYDPSDGKFYAVGTDGRLRTLLPDSFPNAESIEWSKDSAKAIVEFPDGANVSVDLATGKTTTLPAHWEEFDFAPNNSGQIAAKSLGVDPGNRWLVIANADGSSAQTVAALGNNEDKVQVSWSPNDQVVAFSDTGALVSGFGRNQILPIGKNQENLPGLVVEGFSFEPLWSDSGEQILYSTHGPSSNYLPQLWFVDGESNTMGQNRQSLPINTWADKCTYADNTTVYCAVPKELPAGSGLQRALAITEPDTVYRIDTRTGASVMVAEPERDTTMTNLQVSADGSVLFYQNARTGTLQLMNLN